MLLHYRKNVSVSCASTGLIPYKIGNVTKPQTHHVSNDSDHVLYILSRATFPGAPSYGGVRTWVEGSQTHEP